MFWLLRCFRTSLRLLDVTARRSGISTADWIYGKRDTLCGTLFVTFFSQSGASHLEELHRKLSKHVLIRRMKTQVFYL